MADFARMLLETGGTLFAKLVSCRDRKIWHGGLKHVDPVEWPNGIGPRPNWRAPNRLPLHRAGHEIRVDAALGRLERQSAPATGRFALRGRGVFSHVDRAQRPPRNVDRTLARRPILHA